MADKNFKVKNKLVIAGLTNANGVLLAENHAIDSHTNLVTQYGGTGTTTSPTSEQILYSASGTTYAPTTLKTLDVKGSSYSADAPSSPVVGQIWVESDTTSDSFDPNIIRRQSFTATAAQTVFTTDIEFIQGYEQVFFNGMLLLRNSDYTTASNTNVTLASGAAAGDIVEVVTVTNLNSVNTYTQGEIDTSLSAKLSTSTAASTYLTQSNAATTYVPQTSYSVAGKNKILNGDFSIWQRGTTGVNGFLADRWYLNAGAPTSFSQTRQAFTPGTAPVAGYEGKYFWRNTITTVGPSTEWYLNTYIEDVQTLAGQTATFSFWAKADSARSMSGYVLQRFGDGGSTNVSTTIGTASLTTSWQRFTFTISIPSISGKTIGANNLVQIFFAMTPASGMVIDLWGVQLEAGSTATNFSLATGTFATELAACQRYYQTSFDLGQTPAHNASYYGETTLSCVNGGFSTNSYGAILFPVKMRTAPTVNIWNPRNASATGNSARFYSAGVAYDTSTIDMGNTTSSSHGMTFKSNNMGATAIVFFGYSASAEL